MVRQLTCLIAAGAVDELRRAARDCAEVADAAFIVNVPEGVDLWPDAFHCDCAWIRNVTAG